MSRLSFPVVIITALIPCWSCRRQEPVPPAKKAEIVSTSNSPRGEPTISAGQVTFDLELLRAPSLTVAQALMSGSGDPEEDVGLREELLAAGATEILHCGVSGPAGQELKVEKLKTTLEPTMFEFASLWRMQGVAAKEGREIPDFEEDVSTETHEEGYSLTASLEPCEGGAFAKVQFRWMGPPVVRMVNTWPVRGRIARVIQDRKWDIGTRCVLDSDKPLLLAAAPEPPDSDGNPTGFMLMAFGKAIAAAAQSPNERQAAVHTIQCWTLEEPADAAHQWLTRRTGSSGDEAQLEKLLHGAVQRSGPTLLAVEMLRKDSTRYEDDRENFVDSRLTWLEPRGFEPADTRYVTFVPVPNDQHEEAVAQRLEIRGNEARLTLPVGGVKWTRWHGSTRGAIDEPSGVESSATGSSQCGFFTGRESGRVFLANAHTWGQQTRLTFARVLYSQTAREPFVESTITFMETSTNPWLPRLIAGTDLTSLVLELTTAAANGAATVIREEICTLGNITRWEREDTWPWLSFGHDYINPSIHDGKLCFNPRSVSGSTLACRMKSENLGALDANISGEPVIRRFGLWLQGVAGYSAETSGISLSEWPQFSLTSRSILPQGQNVILSVSMGRSWRLPDRPVLHWAIMRRVVIPGSERLNPIPAPAVEPAVSFTITDAGGAVLNHVTLPARGCSISDGRQVQSLQPRAVAQEYYFAETVPVEVSGSGRFMSGQPEIVQALDGMSVIIEDGRWVMEHSLAPSRKITEILTADTEQPAGGNYTSAKVPVACERLVMRQEKLTGILPAPGALATQSLEGGRQLTVRVQ